MFLHKQHPIVFYVKISPSPSLNVIHLRPHDFHHRCAEYSAMCLLIIERTSMGLVRTMGRTIITLTATCKGRQSEFLLATRRLTPCRRSLLGRLWLRRRWRNLNPKLLELFQIEHHLHLTSYTLYLYSGKLTRQFLPKCTSQTHILELTNPRPTNVSEFLGTCTGHWLGQTSVARIHIAPHITIPSS
jgi:hypothetical protein